MSFISIYFYRVHQDLHIGEGRPWRGQKKGVIFITAGNKSWVLSLKSFGFGDTACPLMIRGCFHAFKAFEMAESYPAEVGD